MTSYLNWLAEMGIDGAHPGGFELTKNILRKLHIDRSSSVLDVGCGTGQTAAYIAEQYGADVTAIDLHPTMIAKAKQRFAAMAVPVRLHRASVEALPFPAETFDLALSESVLAFVSLPKALAEIRRVLKKGGTFIGIEACHERLTGAAQQRITAFYGFRQLMTPAEWKGTLEQSGFRCRHFSYTAAAEAPSQGAPLIIAFPSTPEMANMWQTHQQLTAQFGDRLGYCIFWCET
ncbi:SAM-dependent methyltransferase [Geobacillus subterraneus]|uniref:SAM-dependent methyltransferase n=2 Tax=Geobacillus TaxID=129337 RepID=A0ABM6ABP7_9BACL|nr:MULTISPECIES: class I SAM-dependent methyltransferase [Geobacillus]AMX83724.1 SAM-dependent methyltransferase [Geobacillus subterraneus]KZS24426.1 SAM-dependent methyltransferase [Geobacillus subterraneus]OXB87940.1 SAM-dependent methyltransferase [Geobacillus uzenensis]